MMALAALLFLPVLPLQLLGYTGTCTQNDIDPFLFSVVLSTPFAAASLMLAILSAWRMQRRPTQAGYPNAGVLSVVLAILAGLDLFLNAGLARDTLFLGLSPCGADYTQAERLFEPEHIAIGCAYGLVPSLVIVVAGLGFRAARPRTTP